MRGHEEDKNMYELVYSRGKNLKDDERMTYFSFLSVCKYPEFQYLAIFTIFYQAASGINITETHPEDYNKEKMGWEYTYYVYGAFTGLFIVILVSDFIFQQRMLFGPPFLFVLVSAIYHLYLLIYQLFSHTMNE